MQNCSICNEKYVIASIAEHEFECDGSSATHFGAWHSMILLLIFAWVDVNNLFIAIEQITNVYKY